MMSDFMAQPKRQSSEHTVKARHALKLIKPYVPLFEGWNQRAAKASATALSHVSSTGERAQQARVLRDLFEEVRASYDEFETEVAGEPQHSRIDDIRAAFTRLMDVLGHWRN